MAQIMAFLAQNSAIIFGFLFALSEIIGLIPSVKASGVFQAIYNFLKDRAGK